VPSIDFSRDVLASQPERLMVTEGERRQVDKRQKPWAAKKRSYTRSKVFTVSLAHGSRREVKASKKLPGRVGTTGRL
jgi:hypothetical protein